MTSPGVDARSGLRQEAARLAERIDSLESVRAIEDLHRTFVRAVADREFDELHTFYTDDAVIDMRIHGPKAGRMAIGEHFSHMVNTPLEGAGYLLSSPVIDVDGDRAHGVWTWTRFHATGVVAGKTVRIGGVWEEGRYSCDYRREDGRWKFAMMRFRVVKPDRDISPFDADDSIPQPTTPAEEPTRP